jgi:hypothetical protein
MYVPLLGPRLPFGFLQAIGVRRECGMQMNWGFRLLYLQLMNDAVWGPVLFGGSRGKCSLARVSDSLGMEHSVAQVGLTLTSIC